MTQPDRCESVVAEAPPSVPATPVSATSAAAKLALEGDELVQYTLKPSLWFIPIVSFRWVLVMGLFAAALAIYQQRTGWTLQTAIALNVLVGVAALRVAIAILQWASKLYVLTNRRIMRFRGILTVEVTECPLARIGRADLGVEWFQRPLRLGSLGMALADESKYRVVWEHVAHPAEVHERVLRAIRKAQS